MLVKHSLTITAKCPVNPGTTDRYEATVECSRMLPVERILEEAGKFKEQEIFQERLTESLAETLVAKVTTIGFHSGVKTVCEA